MGSKKIAIVVHIYYLELWEEIASYLKKIDTSFDLFITTSYEQEVIVTRKVLASFSNAKVKSYPNHGMDVVPFLKLILELAGDNYLAVCKLHTKKGEGKQGEIWRQALLDSLVGSSKRFDKIATAFEEQEQLAMVGTGAFYQSTRKLMYEENKPNIQKLLRTLELNNYPYDWGFFVGSMFWVKPDVLMKLAFIVGDKSEWFDIHTQHDGAMEHALERVLGLLPLVSKQKMALLLPAAGSRDRVVLQKIANEQLGQYIGRSYIKPLLLQYETLIEDRRVLLQSRLFKYGDYLKQFPFLLGLQVDLPTHYLLIGRFQGGLPYFDFDAEAYRQLYQQYMLIGEDAFLHSIRQEIRQGFPLEQNKAQEGGDISNLNAHSCVENEGIRHEDVRDRMFFPLFSLFRYFKVEGKETKKIPFSKDKKKLDKYENSETLNRPLGDDKRFARVAYNRDHLWYRNVTLNKFIEKNISSPLPKYITRILFISHDVKKSPVSVSRIMLHYLNAMCQLGGYELTSIELGLNAEGKIAATDIDSHDFVIINGLTPFINHSGLLELVSKVSQSKLAIYLHETDWEFDNFMRDYPYIYSSFLSRSSNFNFFCVSEMQAEILKKRLDAKKCYVIYNTPYLPLVGIDSKSIAIDGYKPTKHMKILMVEIGTIQSRKGIELFSKVAGFSKDKGVQWDFFLAGWEVNESIYKLPNVNFLGSLDQSQLTFLLKDIDIFFLSSINDPFPCLEALQLNKKLVVYKKLGVSEILKDLSGVSVYDKYDVDSAFNALEKVICEHIDVESYKKINKKLNLTSFVNRMNHSISEISTCSEYLFKVTYSTKFRICVHLHLYYHDLWHEIRCYLNSLKSFAVDFFITLSNDKQDSEIQLMKSSILKIFPSAVVIVLENRGMDIGPFISVVNHINSNNLKYDLLLKIHSKKSIAAFSRKKVPLLESLLGSENVVAQILSIFENNDIIGMIAPKDMLTSKSSMDAVAGKNLNEKNMLYIANKLQISFDQQLSFFRGAMFWARADIICGQLKKYPLSIDDFEEKKQAVDSRIYAMRRLLPAIITSNGKQLYSFDKAIPRGIHKFKGCHAGSDIYVIAAGATCNYIPPDFFDGKITVGINRVFERYRCNYVVAKEYAGRAWTDGLYQSGAIPVIAKWDSGNINQGKQRLNIDAYNNSMCYFFEHLENTREIVDTSVIHPNSDKLVVSYSTITSGLHFAAYLGAKNIIIVGHDCGFLDGKEVFDGYYPEGLIMPWKSKNEYNAWLGMIEDQSKLVKKMLEKEFDVNVFSINPFLNFGLEGHLYQRARG